MKDNFDKEAYKYYKKAAKEDGVKLGPFGNSYDQDFTFAYVPMTVGPDCRMLAVSVSYKAPEDKFHKKTGKFQALLKMYGGEYVQVPLAQYLREEGRQALENALEQMFEV